MARPDELLEVGDMTRWTMRDSFPGWLQGCTLNPVPGTQHLCCCGQMLMGIKREENGMCVNSQWLVGVESMGWRAWFCAASVYESMTQTIRNNCIQTLLLWSRCCLQVQIPCLVSCVVPKTSLMHTPSVSESCIFASRYLNRHFCVFYQKHVRRSNEFFINAI